MFSGFCPIPWSNWTGCTFLLVAVAGSLLLIGADQSDQSEWIGLASTGLIGGSCDAVYRMVRRRRWFVLRNGGYVIGLPVWYFGSLFVLAGAATRLGPVGSSLINPIMSVLVLMGWTLAIWLFWHDPDDEALIASWAETEMDQAVAESTIRSLINYLDTFGIVKRKELVGCTPYEIEHLQSYAGSRLPTLYVEFMRAMGKDAGDFMVGSCFCYPDVLEFRDRSKEDFEVQGKDRPPVDKSFGFMITANGAMRYFELDDGDNPVVWETQSAEQLVNPTDTLANSLHQWADSERRRRESKRAKRSIVLRFSYAVRDRLFRVGN